jgi:hypothetical protein
MINKTQWENQVKNGEYDLCVWITPDGKVYDASESGHEYFAFQLIKNGKIFYNDYPAEEINEDPTSIKYFLLSKGWVRILDNCVQIDNINDLTTLQKGLRKFDMADIPTSFMIDYGKNYLRVPTRLLMQPISPHIIIDLAKDYNKIESIAKHI